VKKGYFSTLLTQESAIACAVVMIVAVTVWLSLRWLQPPAAVPETAAATEYSSARALKHLQVIAREPRPIGAPRHAQVREYLLKELTALGLSPEVQSSSTLEAFGPELRGGSVKNVVALQADILFDTNSLTAGNVTPGSVSANHIVASSQPAAGVKRLLLYALNTGVLSNGILANLSFTLAPGSYPEALRLGVTNVILVTASAIPVLSTNLPGVIVINPVVIRPDGDVNFFLTVVPNESYIVQGSIDLLEWLDLGRVDTPSAIIEFTDTNAQVYPYRFYRAVSIQP
jgi:hypothetical protein